MTTIRVGLMAGLLTLAAGCAQTGDEVSSAESLSLRGPVVVPNVTARGHSLYGDLGARWWQWVFASPVSRNPLLDATGARCGEGQSGPVWFLAGTLTSESGGAVTRRCAVPFGRTLFFPVVNAEFDPWGVEPAPTDDELRGEIRAIIDGATELSVVVDGVALRGLERGRGAAGPFSYRIPASDDLLTYWGYPGAPPVVDRAWSDGVWMMLAPLAPGAHTVRFGGLFADGSRIDMTYELTVSAPGR